MPVQRRLSSAGARLCLCLCQEPSSNATVACHLQDKRYSDALWRYAMRSAENEGVDYWWTDLCDLGAALAPPPAHIPPRTSTATRAGARPRAAR